MDTKWLEVTGTELGMSVDRICVCCGRAMLVPIHTKSDYDMCWSCDDQPTDGFDDSGESFADLFLLD